MRLVVLVAGVMFAIVIATGLATEDSAVIPTSEVSAVQRHEHAVAAYRRSEDSAIFSFFSSRLA